MWGLLRLAPSIKIFSNETVHRDGGAKGIQTRILASSIRMIYKVHPTSFLSNTISTKTAGMHLVLSFLHSLASILVCVA